MAAENKPLQTILTEKLSVLSAHTSEKRQEKSSRALISGCSLGLFWRKSPLNGRSCTSLNTALMESGKLLIAWVRAPHMGCSLSAQCKGAPMHGAGSCHAFPSNWYPWSVWAACRTKGWKAASHLLHPNDSHASARRGKRLHQE